MEDPSRGTGSGIMQTLQNYGYDIVLLIALLVVASMFVGVCYHAYARYAEIHTGRATWGQFGLTVAVGAILLVVGIWLLTKGHRRPVRDRQRWPSLENPSRRWARDLLAASAQPPSGGRARLTADELWSAPACPARPDSWSACWLAWLTHSIAMVPTLIVAGIGIGVFVGGGLLRRWKRGRPDTWLYRQLQWRLVLRYPALAACGRGQLITRSGWWSTRRLRPNPSLRRGAHEPLQERGRAPAGACEDPASSAAALFVVALLLGFGWWSAPKSLTIHVPPDLRSGSTRKWWDVPPRASTPSRSTSGSRPNAGRPTASRTTAQPECAVGLFHAELPGLPATGLEFRRSNGELRQRVRGIYEIPGRGYGDDPAARVRTVSVQRLDRHARRERGRVLRPSRSSAPGATRAQGRAYGHRPRAQPLRLLALDCYARAPERIETAARRRPAGRPRAPTRPGDNPMKPLVKPRLVRPGRPAAVPGFRAAAQAVEILRWERLPLAVPLVVGQERVVFIDRNVRIGVPAGVGEQLRVQSAGGAIYLRAKPHPAHAAATAGRGIGRLILLDIAAEPAKAGQPALEPVRIVEATCRPRDTAAGQACGDGGRRRGAPSFCRAVRRRWPSC